MTNHTSPASCAASRRPEPFRIGDRIVHATSLAEATRIAALRTAAEAAHAAKLVNEAARKAAAAEARKVERAAAAATDAARKAADRAFEREFAALLAEEERTALAGAARVYWLTGEGKRPDMSRAEPPPVAGTPRVQITARNRPGVGAPIVGDGSRTRPDHGVRAPHEYVPEREIRPVFAPTETARIAAGLPPLFRA